MFPNYLDNAKVLEYTEKGHFGFITDYDETGPLLKRSSVILPLPSMTVTVVSTCSVATIPTKS